MSLASYQAAPPRVRCDGLYRPMRYLQERNEEKEDMNKYFNFVCMSYLASCLFKKSSILSLKVPFIPLQPVNLSVESPHYGTQESRWHHHQRPRLRSEASWRKALWKRSCTLRRGPCSPKGILVSPGQERTRR